MVDLFVAFSPIENSLQLLRCRHYNKLLNIRFGLLNSADIVS